MTICIHLIIILIVLFFLLLRRKIILKFKAFILHECSGSTVVCICVYIIIYLHILFLWNIHYNLLINCLNIYFIRYFSILIHIAKYSVSSCYCMVTVYKGIIICRTIWDCAQKCYLRQIKLTYVTVKIAFCRSLYSVISIGKIYIIQIKLHYLILAVSLFQLYSYKHFLDLALPCFACIQVYSSGKLHCYCTSTLTDCSILHYCLGCS